MDREHRLVITSSEFTASKLRRVPKPFRPAPPLVFLIISPADADPLPIPHSSHKLGSYAACPVSSEVSRASRLRLRTSPQIAPSRFHRCCC